MTALEDLVEALQAARHNVFRLEAHQAYPDDELWQAHLRGELWEADPDLADWCSLVSSAVDRGVWWSRVRVVIEPWAPYTRWEVEQHYPHNVHAGEDIRLMPSTSPWPFPDFWLVDDQRGWLLNYAADGEMTVVEATERSLERMRGERDTVMARAKRWEPVAA